MKRKWLSLSVLAGVLLLLFMTLSGGNGDDANATIHTKERITRVKTWTVVPMQLTDVLTLPGATEALHDVTVSAERSGRVEWIGPEEGAAVTENEAFARIDLDSAQADLSKARSAYDLAKKQAERRTELLDLKVLSKEEMDMANTELQSARSQLSQASKAMSQGDVISPVAGVINELFIDPGEWVNMGQPVAEIVDISSIRINVNAPEMDVRYLTQGQMVRVLVDAYPEATWDGVVDFVAFKADETTKTFRVQVVVDNQDLRIRPGMLARVSMARRVIENAVTAPLNALIDKGGERLVFVADGNKARAHTVKLGAISGSQIQILEGLAPGDELIVSGQNEVEEGVTIEVVGQVKSEAAQQ
ncbi:MAG: efflux RND transporter periplasmic adaptor subunit [Proteobacteria bacterium]|nr:efflux RND transporter periplasmic adaptor subunit [Pseudomonadota bacterium]MBU1611507.1 efflux RND transporter periplasmic adaptor subunit [Pseudomonadota bacterium]